jgi:hypothetical protein
MADIAFYYPTQAGQTNAWEPVNSPFARYEQPRDPGVLSKIMADRVTVVSYRLASALTVYSYTVRFLSAADKTALDSFVEVVLGRTFEMVNPVGGALVVVRFAPEFLGRMAWEYDDESFAAPWSIPILLRTA